MCDSVQRTRILFPHSSFQLPSTRQDSPQTRCKPYKEFRQHVGYTDSDRRKQKINKQRNSCGCRRSGNMTGQKCRTFVYKPYNDKMDRIQEHTLAHPGADFWKADSAGKRPACHRDSHPVKAGPENICARSHHPAVTEYGNYDSGHALRHAAVSYTHLTLPTKA